MACLLLGIAGADPARAHGFAGKRFFPATLATDDPFVADELSLPTLSSRKMPTSGGEPAAVEFGVGVDFTKRITENLGVGFGATYKRIHPDGGDTQRGFDNLSASVKYQIYRNDEHEAIASVGADWDIGGTGAKRVGAESFSTITPTLFFGKGFGDLPDAAKYFRPLALTGSVGVAIPTRASTSTFTDEGDFAVERHPNVLNWGFAVEYSIPYLQSFIRDVGLRAPFNRLIPVLEFSMQTPLDRGGGATIGTLNPGVLWAGQTVQFGLEAVVPINRHSGSRVGVIGQIHFFIDDLFPKSVGKPLFGNRP